MDIFGKKIILQRMKKCDCIVWYFLVFLNSVINEMATRSRKLNDGMVCLKYAWKIYIKYLQ